MRHQTSPSSSPSCDQTGVVKLTLRRCQRCWRRAPQRRSGPQWLSAAGRFLPGVFFGGHWGPRSLRFSLGRRDQTNESCTLRNQEKPTFESSTLQCVSCRVMTDYTYLSRTARCRWTWPCSLHTVPVSALSWGIKVPLMHCDCKIWASHPITPSFIHRIWD